MIKEISLRNNVKRFGNGTQTMLFAHGYGCDQNMWRFITPAFKKDYEIVLFDHVGSGKSDKSEYDFEKYKSLNGYAEDLIEIAVNLELENIILVAHSVSCMIAVLAAKKRPDLFEQLILIGPSPCYFKDGEYDGGFSQEDIDELIETLESNYLGWSSFIIPEVVGKPDQPEITEELKNSFCSMNPDIAKHFAKVTFTADNREDLSEVKTPSLIIQCHPDVIAPIQVGEYVHHKMPDSTFLKIAASGHCPHLTSPKEIIAAIKTYLN